MAERESDSSDSPQSPGRPGGGERRMSFVMRTTDLESPEQARIRELAESLVANRKRRRPSSEMKKFLGDHIGVGNSDEIAALLEQHDDACPLFIDRTSRLALHSHMSECLCLVAEKNVYVLDNRMALLDGEAPIPIDAIERLSTSTERDNAVVLHLPDYRSELLMTPYKTELIGILVSRYRELAGRDLEVAVANGVDFPVSAETTFEVDFIPAAEGVRMTVFCKSARGNPDA
jgi:hypothetical protein